MILQKDHLVKPRRSLSKAYQNETYFFGQDPQAGQTLEIFIKSLSK